MEPPPEPHTIAAARSEQRIMAADWSQRRPGRQRLCLQPAAALMAGGGGAAGRRAGWEPATGGVCGRAAGRGELAPAFPPPPGRARSREPGAAPGEAARRPGRLCPLRRLPGPRRQSRPPTRPAVRRGSAAGVPEGGGGGRRRRQLRAEEVKVPAFPVAFVSAMPA
ncbi:unnamed protein product [Rangifer tarandus platyrhynchus]|uniref:Uncharacterized protein n=2 Tax=Rangifer tarandus platyrhynchus TaxID=3082113 RepID=A0ACB0EPL3_RANTA|nr:unnamed protein product [Rangifer tarandus platyrhynchus]CAI9702607.1 unnamed protein product [Rangifer tarandus platyrhynchus]